MKKISLASLVVVTALFAGCTGISGCKAEKDDKPVVSPDTIDTTDSRGKEPQLPEFKPYWEQK